MVALRLSDLPDTLPLFPLVGVLLLPGGRLPLNVFEPRYLAMTVDALATPGRLIGMIQPTEPELPGRSPALYPLGCAGRIVSFQETEDGRNLITLLGICRFAIAEEIEPVRGYRRVRPDFRAWAADLEPADRPLGEDWARDRFLATLKAYFGRHRIEADWKAINEAPDERLLTTLAMICPFAAAEKQALLEARTPRDRADTMLALLEMAVRGAPGEGEVIKH